MAASKASIEQQQTPAAENKEMRLIEFVPFGAKDKISLSIELIKRLIAVKTKSGKTCSNEEAFKFMLMCQARKLNPFEGDAFLIGYDNTQQPDKPTFSLITAHQAFLKRAEVHTEFDGMESGTIVLRNGEVVDLIGDWHMPNDNVLGGWATVYFKNRNHPMKKRLRLARFNKGYGIWRDDPAGMIVKCAEADALRSSFPTMLGGMFISEELPVQSATEIPHAAFTEAMGTTQVVPELSTPTTTKAPEPLQAPAPQKESEKKATRGTAAQQEQQGATLKRRSRGDAATTSSPSTPVPTPAPTTDPSNREKLKLMLAAGNFNTEEFIALALDEGWITPEIGSWDKLPDKNIEEYLKPDNWQLIMELADERRTKAAAAAANEPVKRVSTTPPGQLL